MEAPTIQSLARQVYFSPVQRQKLTQQVHGLEQAITRARNAPTGSTPGGVEQLERELAEDQRMLEAGIPPDYDGMTKNKLLTLRRKIIEAFTSDNDFCTHDEMERPTSQNATRLLRWNVRHGEKFRALRAINRILDPSDDDTGLGAVAQFRDTTRPMGNPIKFWQGHDAVAWDAEKDQELADALDEMTFFQFLELKMADWAAATIQKKLGISERVYAACMRRLHERQEALRQDAPQGAPDEDAAPDAPATLGTATKEPARGMVRTPEPTPPVVDPDAPAHVAARAIGVEPLKTKDDEPAAWPTSELRPIGVSLMQFAGKCQIPYARLMRGIKNKSFSGEDMATMQKTLAALQQEYRTKRGQTV